MADPDCRTCGGRGHLGMAPRPSNKCPDCTQVCVHGKFNGEPCPRCEAFFEELDRQAGKESV